MPPSPLQSEALRWLEQAGLDVLPVELALESSDLTHSAQRIVNNTLVSLITDVCLRGRSGPELMSDSQDRVTALANFCCYNTTELTFYAPE